MFPTFRQSKLKSVKAVGHGLRSKRIFSSLFCQNAVKLALERSLFPLTLSFTNSSVSKSLNPFMASQLLNGFYSASICNSIDNSRACLGQSKVYVIRKQRIKLITTLAISHFQEAL